MFCILDVVLKMLFSASVILTTKLIYELVETTKTYIFDTDTPPFFVLPQLLDKVVS